MKIPLINYEIDKKGIRKYIPELKTVSSSSFGLTPIQWDLFKKQANKTGTSIYTKLWVAARCISMISENVATLPFEVKNKAGEKVDNEKKFEKFVKKPNPADTGIEVIDQFISYYLLTGAGYIYKNFGVFSTDYYTLQSQNVTPIGNNEIIEAITGYDYKENGRQQTYSIDDIISIKSFNPNSRILGLPRLTAAAKEAEYLGLTDNYKNNLYKNQASPSGIMETDHVLSEDEYNRLNKQIQETYAGVQNAGKVGLLENGLKWKGMSFNPTDLDLIKSELYTESAIATLYGVPIELLGHLAEKKNRANYKEARSAFYVETVIPLANKIVGMLNREFYGDSDLHITINKTEIPELRPTTEDLKGQYWTSPNYKRSVQGIEVKEDELMDKIYLDSNKIAIEDLNEIEDNTEL